MADAPAAPAGKERRSYIERRRPQGLLSASDSAGLVPGALSLARQGAAAAAASVATIGLIVLLGWAADIDALKRVLPDLPSMKANTALAFVASGASLWWLHPDRIASGLLWGRLLALVPLTVGSLTLVEYGAGLDLGIDELMFSDPASDRFPGRPSPITAFAFVFTGASLLVLEPTGTRAVSKSQLLAAIAATATFLGLLGYLYDASLIRGATYYTSMAVHTVVAFLVLLLGVMFAHAERGLMRLLLADDAGGVAARRLIPSTLAFLVFAGWLRLQAQARGLLDHEGGILIMVTAACAFVVLVGGATARIISRQDRALRHNLAAVSVAERQAAEVARWLDQARNRLALAVRSAQIGVWDWDVRSNEIVWDDQMYALYAVAPGTQVRYETWTTAVLPEDLERAQNNLQRAIDDKVPTDNLFRIRWPDGSVRHIAASQGVLCDSAGTVVRVIGVNRDVTRLQEAEASAARALRELESFSYSVAHDLKAPLRAITGFAQILQRKPSIADDADSRECLGYVYNGAVRMGQLIDDLLAMARVQQESFRREPVDLSGMAFEVYGRLVAQLPAPRSIEFRVEPGLVARADAGLVRIVLENLIGNAIKYTSRKPSARIEVGAVTEGTQRAYFVRDDGAGFDMAHAGKLFRPFQRLHLSDQFEGSGIGLATVQRAIERHGGRVRAEGAPGAGAQITFTLE
jgi:signal transduction histidine kinase